MKNHLYLNTSLPLEQVAAPSGDYSPVTSFDFENTRVRTVVNEGIEYFVAKDLAAVLGFKNARQAVRSHVSKCDRRGVQLVDTVGPASILTCRE